MAAPVAPDTTVTVTVDVVIPLAGTLGGFTVTLTRLETAVWVIATELPLPDWASVTLIVQAPGVMEAA
jgi:hypothetical protein